MACSTCKDGRRFVSTTTLASGRAWNLLKLAARQCTTGDVDQQPSKPHEVGVTLGVKVRVGVRVGPGVFVRVAVLDGDGVSVLVGETVFDGVSVMVAVLDGDGVSVIVGVRVAVPVLDGVSVIDAVGVRVGVRVGVGVGGVNRMVSTMRVYCRCGSLSRASIVIV